MSKTVKHSFALFCQDSFTRHTVIDVNHDLQISYKGGDWHGGAEYSFVGGQGQWKLTFHCRADVAKMKTTVYKNVPNTIIFANATEGNWHYNGLLIPRLDDAIPQEQEAADSANEKAFRDEEIAKTKPKKDDLDSTVNKLTTKIDQDSSHSAELKQDVKELEEELPALAKEQAVMDKMHQKKP